MTRQRRSFKEYLIYRWTIDWAEFGWRLYRILIRSLLCPWLGYFFIENIFSVTIHADTYFSLVILFFALKMFDLLMRPPKEGKRIDCEKHKVICDRCGKVLSQEDINALPKGSGILNWLGLTGSYSIHCQSCKKALKRKEDRKKSE